MITKQQQPAIETLNAARIAVAATTNMLDEAKQQVARIDAELVSEHARLADYDAAIEAAALSEARMPAAVAPSRVGGLQRARDASVRRVTDAEAQLARTQEAQRKAEAAFVSAFQADAVAELETIIGPAVFERFVARARELDVSGVVAGLRVERVTGHLTPSAEQPR
jgi:chromosome segregation ATPase